MPPVNLSYRSIASVNADTGEVMGAAVAGFTVTPRLLKLGLFLNPVEHAGRSGS
jgi:hypothetical protein